MRRIHRAAMLAAAFFAGLVHAEEEAKPTANGAIQEVEAAVRAYVDAFNKRDLKAVGELWTDSAVYTNRETGERTESKERILQDIETAFKERPGTRLTIDIAHVRLVRPDLAMVEGRVLTTAPDQDPAQTDLTALLAKSGDKWRIESAQESTASLPPTPYDALKDLEWLVGQWRDQSDEVSVDTTVRWTENQSFLLRSYQVIDKEGVERKGTQVIGWDPRQRQIRSWSFDSDGSFGEATWSKSGEEWVVRIAVTGADGTAITATQVLKEQGENAASIQSVGLEVDGELRPSKPPVKMVRVAPEEASQVETPAATEGQP